MRFRVTILLQLITVLAGYAQTPDLKEYKIEGHNIVLHLDTKMPRTEQEKLLAQTGMEGLSLDTLWKFNSIGRWAKEGWKFTRTNTGYKIFKSITDLSGDIKWNKAIIHYKSGLATTIQSQVNATFGANRIRNGVVLTDKTGTRFFLKGYRSAKDVYLSGTFNEWSTLKTRMIKSDSGWYAVVPLQPGKHQYKFIIDSHWMEDPRNDNREDDGQGGLNSVYFVTNYEFSLTGYNNAKRVILAGTFNNWNERDLRMIRTAAGWKLPVYLKDGSYQYKFIVDDEWITDPANPNTRDDGSGKINSFLQLGDAALFRLPGNTTARRVILAGEFNNWNEQELAMNKTATGWELPYVLAPGNYQYKFIVDGQWMTDPANPHLASLHGHTNSVISIKPNHTFILKQYLNAATVSVAGTFNDWGVGYTMRKTSTGWIFQAYLPPGKHLYKFIVDGKWIIDPDNELWEQNEFRNGNSVLWIAPEEE
ncbi:MAG TPA: glycogen-binding domain-containing protein [Cyclobacteriaceae bacterium]|nr:glycogen-binding domain-containing protein [Cyclobacteriaceae bacterium]HMV10646.1 glycogen-binding domain-containing protein [Cyclobacteriaceae bacterium]HMX02507.1 glycogen-binding domain-containing protein [Cyclobacteriaceae bacterium]HMX52063.1 glycogen-binding domain-containing protein [Cyclobacteriaceae bacterium]HMY91667.1 glycogen-binding domain-containing protein [Cyclobacteriaceae bacterium]